MNARAVVSSPFSLPKGNVLISFSGGRTSGYMLHQIAAANGGLPDRCQVVFANTGREMPETLDFVAEISRRWQIDIALVERRRGKPGFEIVGRQGAAQDGEPFAALIQARRFLPNQEMRFCTTELKVQPTARYLRSLGWDRWSSALGIRADEPERINRKPSRERWVNWYPLADAGISKADVAAFWRRQPFDLRLFSAAGKTPLGNCDGCFLKSEATLAMLARDYPARHAWWESMEAETARRIGKAATAATFSSRYSRASLRDFVERQGDWIFDAEDALCQKDDGECMADFTGGDQ